MDSGVPVDPDSFDLPPHDNNWPTRFLVGDWVDALTTSWRSIPNSEGIRARRNAWGEFLLRDPDTLDVYTYSLTPAIFAHGEELFPIYIAER